MDPNEFLPATRTEFHRTFLNSVEAATPHTLEALFKKAEAARSSTEQRDYLHASMRLRQGRQMLDAMSDAMDGLLNRSFQTTYNTFRPTSVLKMQSDSLSLVDSHALENELLLNEITARFRAEAEEQIRDLNIRIALLFSQEKISERENPFRPYLITRSIASGIEKFELDDDISAAVIAQIAEDLTPHIGKIYDAVNNYFAAKGVAAELQLKIKKTPPAATTTAVAAAPDTSPQVNDSMPCADMHNEGVMQGAMHQHSFSGDEGLSSPAYPAQQLQATPAATPVSKVEQLFNSVRDIAAGISTSKIGSATQQFTQQLMQQAASAFTSQPTVVAPYPGLEGYAAPIADPGQTRASAFQWLEKNQSVGSTLRQLFGGHGEINRANDDATNRIPNSSSNGVSTGNAEGHAPGQTLNSAHQLPHTAYGSAQTSATPTANSDHRKHSDHAYSIADSNHSDSSTGIVQSVHELQKNNIITGEQMFNHLGGIRNLILEQRTTLNDMTDNVDEQMTIDVVAMLFEFILSDPQVPAEIRAQLGRLQFLVLKIALRDQTLLTQKGHPARMLINRVGSISLGLKQIDPTGAHITQEICRIVETLLEDDSESSQLFIRMLDEFDAFIARELRSSEQTIAHTVEAIETAQNRTLRLVHISAQLREVLQKLQIDPYLRDFLENTWVHAIEYAEREDAKRGIRYRLLIPDLLWSIVAKLNEEDRTQLFALLPIILNTLREALTAIQWNNAKQKHLLDWLVDAHTNALRTVQQPLNPQTRSLSLPAIHEHFADFIYHNEASQEALHEQLRAPETQQRLDKAIRDLDIQVQMLDEFFDSELAAESAIGEKPVDTVEFTQEVIQERLRSGISLEVKLGIKPSIATLNWVDPSHHNLVLTLAGNEKPSLVSVRMFRRMIAHGRVRFLENEPLFERAVQALLTSADAIDHPAFA